MVMGGRTFELFIASFRILCSINIFETLRQKDAHLMVYGT